MIKVTLALFLVGGLPPLRSFLVVWAQLLGGIAAAGVVSALFPGPLAVDTLLGGGTSISQGLFIEVSLRGRIEVGRVVLRVRRPAGAGLLAGKDGASADKIVVRRRHPGRILVFGGGWRPPGIAIVPTLIVEI